jgi:hypothetical protein
MTIVRLANGRKRAAVMLALTGGTMRLALKDTDDVMECKLVDQTWISEDCEPVTFEFPLGVFEAIGIMPPGPGAGSFRCK